MNRPNAPNNNASGTAPMDVSDDDDAKREQRSILQTETYNVAVAALREHEEEQAAKVRTYEGHQTAKRECRFSLVIRVKLVEEAFIPTNLRASSTVTSGVVIGPSSSPQPAVDAAVLETPTIVCVPVLSVSTHRPHTCGDNTHNVSMLLRHGALKRCLHPLDGGTPRTDKDSITKVSADFAGGKAAATKSTSIIYRWQRQVRQRIQSRKEGLGAHTLIEPWLASIVANNPTFYVNSSFYPHNYDDERKRNTLRFFGTQWADDLY